MNKLKQLGRRMLSKTRLYMALLALALTGMVAPQAHAQTDATTIVTAVTSAFVLVAGACVTIGTFFVVYRLVKRIK